MEGTDTSGAGLSMDELLHAIITKLKPAHPRHTTLELINILDVKIADMEPCKGHCTLTPKVQELDALEQQLQSSIIKARRLRNMSLPVNRLPAELLALCFDHLQEKDRLSGEFLPLGINDWDFNAKRWLSVTEVCHHWRTSAIETPSLWTAMQMSADCGLGPTDDENQCVRTILHRSGTAPLTIMLGFRKTPYNDRILEIVGEHCGRMQEFHISLENAVVAPFEAALAHPAPALIKMTIADVSELLAGVGMPLVFGGQTPALRELSVCGFPSFNVGNTFGGLTHLCLHDQPAFSRPTMSKILDILELSPRLEELALVAAGPTLETEPDVYPIGRKVELLHLRVLDIGDWPSAKTVAQFLSHLVLPATVGTHIWGGTLLLPDEDVTCLFPKDTSGLPHLFSATRLHLYRHRSLGSPEFGPDFNRVTVSSNGIWITGCFSAPQVERALVSSMFCMADITFLCVHDCDSQHKLPASFFRTVFNRLPGLKELSVWDCACRGILSALLPLSPPPTPSNSAAPVARVSPPTSTVVSCPLIDTIIIEDNTVSSLFIHDFGEKRAAAGHPVETLYFESEGSNVDFGGGLTPPPPRPRLHIEEDVGSIRKVYGVVEVNSDDVFRIDTTGWPSRAWTWTRGEENVRR